MSIGIDFDQRKAAFYSPLKLATFRAFQNPKGAPLNLQDTDVTKQATSRITDSTSSQSADYFVLRIAAILVLLCLISTEYIASNAKAAPFTFEFSGVIVDDHLDDLFPAKSFGDSYSGTFTVDTAAIATLTTPDAAVYDGSLFDVTIEGISYDIHDFRVWKTSPPDGGVQFQFNAGNGDSVFLALRSTSGLYSSVDVPTSYNVVDFDSHARLSQRSSCFGDFLSDTGSVDSITPDGVDPLTFNFSGVVGDNQLDTLFPDKSIGDPYSGSFTVDPAAATTHIASDATFYEGNSFDLTIEGVSHNVSEFRVWNSSPPGGGIEFVFNANGETASFSLRSTSGLYGTTDVPTSYDIADFDGLSRVHQFIDCSFLEGEGSIITINVIPEPASIALLAIGLIGLGCRYRIGARSSASMVAE